jgi:hypothetical protein
MRIIAALGFLAVSLAAAPVLAHHISGTVYCDLDSDGVIDVPGDTPVVGVAVLATSLDVSPGQQFSDGTDGAGDYYIALPARTDHYRVELVGLPGGWSVVVPGGGVYVIQIITASAQDHADGVNFLVQGCAPTTTTSSTTSTTASTSTSTSSAITTTTTSTTTTTTLLVCDCPATPFLVARDAKVNNDGTVSGSIGANDLGGRVRLARGVTMPDGSRITADRVSLGNGTSVSQVFANTLFGPNAVVRNGTGLPTLPIVTPFCSVPALTCGTNDVQVSPGSSEGPLPPGTYGRLRVLNGATVVLAPGEFTFCGIKTGRNATITTLGPATLNVAGKVVIGTGSHLGPASGTDPVRVNVAGRSVRVSQGAFANAGFIAPAARISFGRGSLLLGCFCTDRAKSDKHITLACPTS